MLLRRIILALLLSQVAPLSLAAGEAPALRLGVHPYLPELFVYQRFTPLADYLSHALERKVSLRVSADYRSQIIAVAAGELDLAYLGPASYVKLVDEFGPFPLLARQAVLGEPSFNGVIVSKRGSGISRIEDLRGKQFAFGNPSSTMSHLLPRYVLLKNGISVTDLGGYEFVGDHQAVAVAVLRGHFDAGAVKQEVYARYRRRGLELIALTPSISEHLFVARKDLPEDVVEELRQIFLGLDDSEMGREVLRAIKPSVTAMVPVVDSDYDSLRKIIDSLRQDGVGL